MAQPIEPPLDEINWRSPGCIQYLRQFGGLNANTIHFYFNQSPFSIQTSNNSSLLTQAQFNPALQHLQFNRDALEGRLRSMRGIEFVVVYPPPNPTTPPRPGFFLIRKQNRRGPDDVTSLGTYFCVNENIYQAPTMDKVIGSKVLNIARVLKDVEGIVRKAREGEQVKEVVRDREKEVGEMMLLSSFEKTFKWGEEYLDGEKKKEESAASSQVSASQATIGSQASLPVSEKLKSVVVGKEKEKKEEKIVTPTSAGGTNKKRRKSKIMPGNGLSTPTTETPNASFGK